MKRLLLSCAIIGTSFTTTAFAQSAYPEGFSPYGYIAVSSFGLTDGGDSETLFNGDLGFSWDFGGNFGIDYSMFGFHLDGDTSAAHYLALAYNFGDLRFSVGAPRAAFDQYGSLRIQRTVPIFGLELGSIAYSTITYLDLSSGSDAQSYGLRLDGSSSGGLEYAVSVHGVDGGSVPSDLTAITASARYTLASDLVLTGGIDYVTAGSTSLEKAKLGVSKAFGQFDAALNVLFYGSSGDHVTFYELSGAYNFSEQLSVGLGVFGASENVFADLYTVDATYRFFDRASVFGSLTQTEGSGSDGIYTLGLRYDF